MSWEPYMFRKNASFTHKQLNPKSIVVPLPPVKHDCAVL